MIDREDPGMPPSSGHPTIPNSPEAEGAAPYVDYEHQPHNTNDVAPAAATTGRDFLLPLFGVSNTSSTALERVEDDLMKHVLSTSGGLARVGERRQHQQQPHEEDDRQGNDDNATTTCTGAACSATNTSPSSRIANALKTSLAGHKLWYTDYNLESHFLYYSLVRGGSTFLTSCIIGTLVLVIVLCLPTDREDEVLVSIFIATFVISAVLEAILLYKKNQSERIANVSNEELAMVVGTSPREAQQQQHQPTPIHDVQSAHNFAISPGRTTHNAPTGPTTTSNNRIRNAAQFVINTGRYHEYIGIFAWLVCLPGGSYSYAFVQEKCRYLYVFDDRADHVECPQRLHAIWFFLHLLPVVIMGTRTAWVLVFYVISFGILLGFTRFPENTTTAGAVVIFVIDAAFLCLAAYMKFTNEGRRRHGFATELTLRAQKLELVKRNESLADFVNLLIPFRLRNRLLSSTATSTTRVDVSHNALCLVVDVDNLQEFMSTMLPTQAATAVAMFSARIHAASVREGVDHIRTVGDSTVFVMNLFFDDVLQAPSLATQYDALQQHSIGTQQQQRGEQARIIAASCASHMFFFAQQLLNDEEEYISLRCGGAAGLLLGMPVGGSQLRRYDVFGPALDEAQELLMACAARDLSMSDGLMKLVEFHMENAQASMHYQQQDVVTTVHPTMSGANGAATSIPVAHQGQRPPSAQNRSQTHTTATTPLNATPIATTVTTPRDQPPRPVHGDVDGTPTAIRNSFIDVQTVAKSNMFKLAFGGKQHNHSSAAAVGLANVGSSSGMHDNTLILDGCMWCCDQGSSIDNEEKSEVQADRNGEKEQFSRATLGAFLRLPQRFANTETEQSWSLRNAMTNRKLHIVSSSFVAVLVAVMTIDIGTSAGVHTRSKASEECARVNFVVIGTLGSVAYLALALRVLWSVRYLGFCPQKNEFFIFDKQDRTKVMESVPLGAIDLRDTVVKEDRSAAFSYSAEPFNESSHSFVLPENDDDHQQRAAHTTIRRERQAILNNSRLFCLMGFFIVVAAHFTRPSTVGDNPGFFVLILLMVAPMLGGRMREAIGYQVVLVLVNLLLALSYHPLITQTDIMMEAAFIIVILYTINRDYHNRVLFANLIESYGALEEAAAHDALREAVHNSVIPSQLRWRLTAISLQLASINAWGVDETAVLYILLDHKGATSPPPAHTPVATPTMPRSTIPTTYAAGASGSSASASSMCSSTTTFKSAGGNSGTATAPPATTVSWCANPQQLYEQECRAIGFVEDAVSNCTTKCLDIVRVFGNTVIVAGPLEDHRSNDTTVFGPTCPKPAGDVVDATKAALEIVWELLSVRAEEAQRPAAVSNGSFGGSFRDHHQFVPCFTIGIAAEQVVNVFRLTAYPSYELMGLGVNTARALALGAPTPGTVVATCKILDTVTREIQPRLSSHSTPSAQEEKVRRAVSELQFGQAQMWSLRGLGRKKTHTVTLGKALQQ